MLAFNDVFLTICVLACLTLLWIGTRQLRMYITGVNPMADALATMAKMRAQPGPTTRANE